MSFPTNPRASLGVPWVPALDLHSDLVAPTSVVLPGKVGSEHLPQPGDGLAGEFVGACGAAQREARHNGIGGEQEGEELGERERRRVLAQ